MLAHKPNLAITPKGPPIEEYIAMVEQACQKPTQGEAKELQAEVKAALKKTPSMTQHQQGRKKALKDKPGVNLTADKGGLLWWWTEKNS